MITQLVEYRTDNSEVTGSIPVHATTLNLNSVKDTIHKLAREIDSSNL